MSCENEDSAVLQENNIQLCEHSNANLLKINTHDPYSTVGALKKQLAKEIPAVRANVEAQKPLFQGMVRMNKNPKMQYLFMAFETEKDRVDAAELLKTVKYRGRFWEEEEVTDKDLAVTHKGSSKRPRPTTEEGSKLTQYENYTIEEQHAIKKKSCLSTMKNIVPTFTFGREEYLKRFQGIVESPQLTGYRNHVSLSFGLTDQKEPTVGFQKGAIVEGQSSIESAVDEGKDVVTMHPIAKAAAQEVMKVFHEFSTPEKGSLGMYNKIKGEGFWRRLQIRHNIYGEVLMDLELDADSTTPEIFSALLDRLKDVLTSLQVTEHLQKASGSPKAKVIGLVYHKHSGISSLADNVERVCVFGDSVLTEYVNGLKFELSPTAFFQVNTPGMEKMLEKVSQAAELTPSTTLLDLCSGTGTIGLCLAKYVKKVIGIELVDDAVQNARRNASLNNIQNAEFLSGRVEVLLPTVVNSLSPEDREDIVAVLDPPRAGVVPTVIKWIRGTPTIRRVVYISCEQSSLVRDCPSFTKPRTKAYRGQPFEVTSGFAVDLFPHTHHVEMVAVLTRTKSDGAEETETEDGAKATE